MNDFMLFFSFPITLCVLISSSIFLYMGKKKKLTRKLFGNYMKIAAIGLLASNLAVPIFAMVVGLGPILVASSITILAFNKELS